VREKIYGILDKENCCALVECHKKLGWKLYVLIFCYAYTVFSILCTMEIWIMVNLFGWRVVP